MKRPIFRLPALLMCLLACLSTIPVAVRGVELARESQTAWRIVLPDSPTPVETTAARELAEHLQLVTGAEFPTLSESQLGTDTPARNCIFIGNTTRRPEREYRFDEILIRVTPDGNVILAGHERRGCLYAVMSFLQDTVGVRWWTASETYVPKCPTLEIPDDLDITYAPQMISREMYHRDAQPGVFSARMKGNGFITPEYGGRVPIINFVHSFYKYIPPATYFEAHPEWFSEIEGVRKHEHAQLCLTNPELQQEVIRRVLEDLRKNPGARMIDVSQNDWYGFCTCQRCRALDEAEESHAGTLVQFLNVVAEAVEKEFPDVLVESLAYQYTRKPPKTLRPRDNVLIRLCTIECSFCQPLTHEQNQKFAEDMAGWSRIAKYLFIWDYVTNYRDYLGPHPNLHVLAPNVRYFVDNGAIGLFAEGEGDDFVEMRNWVLMRLMWEPELDENALFDEFARGYYGAAVAPFIKEYHDVLKARVDTTGAYIGCFPPGYANWLDHATVARLSDILTRAVAVSTQEYGPESAELARLEKSKMAIDSMWLPRYHAFRRESVLAGEAFHGPADPRAAALKLAEQCRRWKTKAVHISRTEPAEYFEGVAESFLAFQNPPEMCRDLPEYSWFVFDAVGFANFRNAATIVEDPEGWNGKSVRMGTQVDWNTSFRPDVSGKYRVLASLRCDGTGPTTGKLGSWGAYDPEEKKGLRTQVLTADMFLLEGQPTTFDPKFRWVDLGVVDFKPGVYVWFAHGHSELLNAIHVDRAVLIAE